MTEPTHGMYLRTYVEGVHKFLSELPAARRSVMFTDMRAKGEPQEDFITNFFGTDVKQSTARFCIEVEMSRMLPSPPATATVQDIVEYKQKHRDEFLALHDHIDKQSFIFSQAGEVSEGLRLTLKEIEPILRDIGRSFLEKWPNRVMGSLRQHIGSFTGNAVAGATLGLIVDQPIGGAIAAAAKGSLKAFVTSVLKGREYTERTKPFAYCYHEGQL